MYRHMPPTVPSTITEFIILFYWLSYYNFNSIVWVLQQYIELLPSYCTALKPTFDILQCFYAKQQPPFKIAPNFGHSPVHKFCASYCSRSQLSADIYSPPLHPVPQPNPHFVPQHLARPLAQFDDVKCEQFDLRDAKGGFETLNFNSLM